VLFIFNYKQLLDTCVGDTCYFRTTLCTLNLATLTHIIKNFVQGFLILLSLQHVATEAFTPSCVFWDGSKFKSRPVSLAWTKRLLGFLPRSPGKFRDNSLK